MARYEVFIPKSANLPMNMRLRLEADSWVEALKAGLAKVGEGGAAAENVLCDIMDDNSIHVTDATSGRVFQIIELPSEEERAEEPTQPHITPPPPASADVTQPDMPAAESDFEQEATQPNLPVAAPMPEPEPPRPVAPPAPLAPEPTAPAAPQAPPAAAGQAAPAAPQPPPPDLPSTTTESGIGRALDFTSESTADLLEEIFEITDKVNQQPDRSAALYFMLDLAMNTVGTDAGSILLSDINSDVLSFGAARGPKAEEVMGFKVKVGQGIVGFSTEAGVGVAISDATRDPRFYAAISEKIGYPTRSILCVPVRTDERVFGALELINKKSNDTFNERDLGLANFIGQQLARYLSRGA